MTDSEPHPVETLTNRERECLRAVPLGTSKEIAQAVGISHETVNKHIAAGKRKLKTNSRRKASQIVLMYEAATTHKMGTQPLRLASSGESTRVSEPYPARPTAPEEQRVREMSAEFGHDLDRRFDLRAGADQRKRNALSPLQTIAFVLAIAIGIVVILSAALPIAEGFRALSNFIEPYKPM